MVALRYAIVLGIAHLFHQCAAHNPSSQQIVHDLQAELSSGSEVVLTTDPAFAKDFAARFSSSHSPKFVIGVKPALVKDVQKVVKYASSQNVPFLATGGGHGYTWSLGGLQGGIQLDLGNFQTIEIDAAANTMTVGGAVRIGNVTHDLQAVGKDFPVGMCPTVGLAGLTLGGGVGPYGGLYGASSDSLLSAEVVTGTGEILNVSATQHSDLFYGLRGAGFNYGVVTSLKYRVYPAANGGEVTIVNAVFPGSLNGSLFAQTNKLVGRQPGALSILIAIRYNATEAGMVFTASFIYVGPQAEALQVIKPFLDLKPLNVEVNTAAYSNITNVALYGEVATIGPMKGIDFAPYALNLKEIDVHNIISIIDWFNDTLGADPDLQTATLSWAQYSTAGFARYPVDSSAFPFRDVAVWLSYDGFTTNASLVPVLDKLGKEVRSRAQAASGYPCLETYVNFGHGDEGPEAWYTASKLPRLRALKGIYDPGNLFSYFNPVVS